MNSSNSVDHSFNELALRYVASHADKLSQSQLDARLDQLGHHVMDYFGRFKLTDITPARVQKFAYHLEMQGMKTSSIERCMVTFRACMKFAKNLNWPVEQLLSRPISFKNEVLTPQHQHLSSQEFNLLYQDLVQDISKDMFH
jgi:site-specific recombinase XerD